MTRRLIVVRMLLAVALVAGCSSAPNTASPSSGTPNVDGTSAPQADEPPEPAAGLPYDCGAEAFDVRLFSRPSGDERENSPIAAALADLIRRDSTVPATGWWLASQTATRSQYVARAKDGFWSAIVERTAGGSWHVTGWGSCQPTYRSFGQTTVEWAIELQNRPAAADTTIDALVIDPCQPAPLDHRLGPPVIRTTPDAVLVVFTATPGVDTGDVCIDGKPLAVTVTLDEPVGARRLLDGAHWPARDATVPLAP